MKNLYVTILFFASTHFLFGQKEIAVVKKLGTKYSEIKILEAVKKADWCGYFHETSGYTITFDDGATVELLSKKEIISSVKLNDTCFQNENTQDNGIYKIHESGILIRMLSARNTSKN